MLISNIFLWWYSAGWKNLIATLFAKMGDALSFFSIGSLLRTLFAPFRQISAGEPGAGASRLQAFGDRLLSRCVGAVVRILLMIAGIAVFITEAIVFIAIIICWPLIPFMPILGVALTCMGVTF